VGGSEGDAVAPGAAQIRIIMTAEHLVPTIYTTTDRPTDV